ncbi:type III secretion effector protein [Pseudomonas sp. SDO524_S393]
MSVSTLDTSRSKLPTPEAPQAGPTSKAQARPSAPVTAGIHFPTGQDKAGPVFGEVSPSPDRYGPFPHASQRPGTKPGASQPQSFLDMLKQLLAQWLGGNRPSRPHACNSAPPRPNPSLGRPDPVYSTKNNDELTKQLLDNFKAFRDPKNPGFISRDSLEAMAGQSLVGASPDKQENIKLAREILRRPDLVAAMDRHSSTGAQDGLIDRQNLGMLMGSENFFKYKNDQELTGEMLEHFDGLNGYGGRGISSNDLKKLAAQPLTGDSAKDHLIQLAQEFLKRSDLRDKLDRNNDGQISRWELQRLPR